jgi:hypothetical protein
MRSMRSGSFESFRSVKNLERLSKKQSNNQPTDQSGTVDFSYQSPTRQSASLNVFGFLQIDSAVSRLLWIDLHDATRRDNCQTLVALSHRQPFALIDLLQPPA